jgi:hypothetical protein
MGSRRSDLWKTPEGAHRDAYQLDDPARAPDAIETAAATAEPDQRRHPAPNLPFALTTGVPAVLTPSHDRDRNIWAAKSRSVRRQLGGERLRGKCANSQSGRVPI